MKLVIGNQKAYMNSQDVDKFIKDSSIITNSNNTIICPSSIYLDRYKNTNFKLGSQTVSNYPNGSSTGELTAEQLKSMDITYSIVGHSERRQNQSESNTDINIKIKNLLKWNITPILCIGESKIDRQQNKYKDILSTEIITALENLSTDSVEKIIIAYEPIWAIGTGIIPTNDEIDEIAKYVKDIIKTKYDCDIKVIYGGSVNEKNIELLNEIDSIDGYLIGGASTKIEAFKTIIEKCQ